jgi:hypothetical protein
MTNKTITKDELDVLKTIIDANKALSTEEITELFILSNNLVPEIDLSLPIPEEISERFEAAVTTLNVKQLIKEESCKNSTNISYQVVE